MIELCHAKLYLGQESEVETDTGHTEGPVDR